MARPDPSQHTIVYADQEKCHEPSCARGIRGQTPVQVLDDLREASRLSRPDSHSCPCRGHKQRRGGTMAGDIADDHTQASTSELRVGQEVQVIASHGVRGAHPARQIETGEVRHDLWQQAFLHLSREGEVPTHGGVLLSQGVSVPGEFHVGRHARLYDGRPDGFRNIVYGPQPEPPGLVLHFAHRCHEDNWHVPRARVGLEPAAHLVAVHLRHHHVEQHQVGTVLREGDLKRACPAGGNAQFVVLTEQIMENFDVDRGVVHNQDSWFFVQSITFLGQRQRAILASPANSCRAFIAPLKSNESTALPIRRVITDH